MDRVLNSEAHCSHHAPVALHAVRTSSLHRSGVHGGASGLPSTVPSKPRVLRHGPARAIRYRRAGLLRAVRSAQVGVSGT